MGIAGGPSAFGVIGTLLLILLVVLWFIIASAAALRGDSVDKPNRMPQMYGYTVCIIAVILILTTTSSLIDAAFDRAHPLHEEHGFGASLNSFEAFKATYQRDRLVFDRTAAAQPDTASEETLRHRYDALVADQLATTVYRTTKTFVTSGLLLLIAIGLFVVHWRWLARLNTRAVTTG
jgi:hypothetical protein